MLGYQIFIEPMVLDANFIWQLSWNEQGNVAIFHVCRDIWEIFTFSESASKSASDEHLKMTVALILPYPDLEFSSNLYSNDLPPTPFFSHFHGIYY